MTISRIATVMAMRERDAIKDPRLLTVSLIVLALVLAAFVLHSVLHLEPAVVAIVGGLLLLALSRLNPDEVAHDVEWHTLVFFAGLFIMVGALVNTGVIGQLSQAATEATEGQLWGTTMLLLWASAGLSAIVDNIPYVATMSPIVADLVQANGTPQGNVLWWALALGADLGGNATAIGASANVVDPRHRRTRRQADQLLGVHQVRAHRHRHHDRDLRAVPLPAVLLMPARTRGASDHIARVG